jgi:branched-chain amino acid transport system permease protein
LLAIASAFLVPVFVESNFWLYLLDMVLINAVLALGLNVILKTGQVSLAHAGFMAIGAFTSAQLTVKLGVPFLGAFLIAGAAAALAALVLGRIILRLRGVYFLLFTFSLNEFLFLLSKNVPALTGGNTGVVGIRPPALPFVGALSSKADFYYLALTVLVLAVLFVGALYRSPFGRAMNAVRESELLAAAAGYNPMRIKVITFSIGSLLAGFGGSLFAHFLGYIAPFNFTFWESVNFLLMNIVGGSSLLAGAILGAIIITPLPEVLRAYVVWQQVLYGLILMLFMRFLPDGIASVSRGWPRGARGRARHGPPDHPPTLGHAPAQPGRASTEPERAEV